MRGLGLALGLGLDTSSDGIHEHILHRCILDSCKVQRKLRHITCSSVRLRVVSRLGSVQVVWFIVRIKVKSHSLDLV